MCEWTRQRKQGIAEEGSTVVAFVFWLFVYISLHLTLTALFSTKNIPYFDVTVKLALEKPPDEHTCLYT